MKTSEKHYNSLPKNLKQGLNNRGKNCIKDIIESAQKDAFNDAIEKIYSSVSMISVSNKGKFENSRPKKSDKILYIDRFCTNTFDHNSCFYHKIEIDKKSILKLKIK